LRDQKRPYKIDINLRKKISFSLQYEWSGTDDSCVVDESKESLMTKLSSNFLCSSLNRLQFPWSQWKALRTTNALERINEEFRRHTKTQASLPGEDAVLLLLYGLPRSGQITLRRIDGRQDLPRPQAPLKAA
jgi:hypothetical protein